MKRLHLKGLTLIEMVLVIGIIALLLGLIFPRLQVVQARSRDLARKWSLYTISTTFLTYYNESESYPMTGGCITEELDWFHTMHHMIPLDPIQSHDTLWCIGTYRFFVLPKNGVEQSAVLLLTKVESEKSGNYDLTAIPTTYEEAKNSICTNDSKACDAFSGSAYYAILL